jgi:hypothetical protein
MIMRRRRRTRRRRSLSPVKKTLSVREKRTILRTYLIDSRWEPGRRQADRKRRERN